MIAEIRKHLTVLPFVPFRIRMSDGQEYGVPTLNHVYLPPAGRFVVVSDDEGLVALLPSMHVTGVLTKTQQQPAT